MKKFTSDYFEKKFRILFDKLLAKEGFIDEIQKARKELGIPVENGFPDDLRLAVYLTKKLTEDEKRFFTFAAFVEQYEIANHARITDKDKDNLMRKFFKKHPSGINPLDIKVLMQSRIKNHDSFITHSPFVSHIKTFAKIFAKEWAIFNKFFGFDLLDEHIAMHFIEQYLFLGQTGVSGYIKNKVACHNCKHIGIAHFSPDRNDMDGQDEGPFSGKYIFNENTNKMLSSHFNSVFIIIKPYATKEQALLYVEENWDDLKEHLLDKNTFYRQFDVHPSKIKESDTERNQLVYDYSKLSKKDLLKIYDGEKDLSLAGIYKERIISEILKKKYDIEMSPEAVKKAVTRFAKNVKAKRPMKDVRDI